ncbi:MAG TPA: PqiC family protein [Polyangiaceae bacterium]|jgi:hypothetical protein|nr:PqiC family protein [Polyangiaceae bacterium]
MSRVAASAALGLLLCATGASACGSSPPSSFYALSPESGSAQPAPVRTIKLRRPGIPGYLDRPEIVKRVADHRLRVTDTDRWAAPLDEMLGRILAQDLEDRLTGSVVFTEDGAITADADVTLEVDVRRFDVDDRGQVELVAEIALEKGDAHTPAGTRAVHLHVAPGDGTTSALVAAMSDVLGKLSDEVTGMLLRASAAPLASDR